MIIEITSYEDDCAILDLTTINGVKKIFLSTDDAIEFAKFLGAKEITIGLTQYNLFQSISYALH